MSFISKVNEIVEEQNQSAIDDWGMVEIDEGHLDVNAVDLGDLSPIEVSKITNDDKEIKERLA